MDKRSELEVAVEALVIRFAHGSEENPQSSRVTADEIVDLVERVLIKGEEVPEHPKPWEFFAIRKERV